MINKLFFIFICYIPLSNSIILAQNISYGNNFIQSVGKNLQQELFTSLDSLIDQIRNNNIKESLLWKKESKLSKAIFEDIHSYEKSYQDSTYKSKVFLLNCYPISKERYLNQIAYYRQEENNSKSLQMLITIIAHKENKKICFSTPLNYYTETWKEHQVGSITYYFRDKINIHRAEKFAKKNIQFSSRFKKPVKYLSYFMVENYQEILKLIGFDYNAKSIGELRSGYGILGDQIIFSVMNNEDFSHDLFHYYSETIHDWSVRNWVVEEGLAYSWGNAYYTRKDGEMAEQNELLKILKKYIDQNKDIDLLSLFENNFWTDKSGIYEHLAPDFIVGRLISSLICDEVYNKYGMEGINKLLIIGSKPNHFDPFFKSINTLIGINRNNFNEKVNQLIKNYN